MRGSTLVKASVVKRGHCFHCFGLNLRDNGSVDLSSLDSLVEDKEFGLGVERFGEGGLDLLRNDVLTSCPELYSACSIIEHKVHGSEVCLDDSAGSTPFKMDVNDAHFLIGFTCNF